MEKRKIRTIDYVLMGISGSFILLTVLISFFPQTTLDVKFSHEIQEHQNPWLDQLMVFISWFGYYPASVIVVTGTALLFAIFKRFKEAFYILFTSIASLIDSGIKLLVNRPRPTDNLVRIVRRVQDQSFPSGHVVFYVVFFGFLMLLMYYLKTIPTFIRIIVGLGCFFLISTVPVSRIYLGAHWFTDVLGGFLLGLLCLYVVSYLYLKAPRVQRS